MTVPQLAATTGLMAQALPGDPVPVRHHGWKPRADLPGVVELFAGLGCVARGFERSGRFQTVLLSDVDQDARSTFVANRPDSANILWVPESRSWVLSCGFVDEAIRPR
jgi:hypothetical protein